MIVYNGAMKPMHASIIRLSRCPCCQTKYSTRSMRKKNIGKSAARNHHKREIRRELNQ